MEKEDLLEEAKRRYPVGVVYRVAHFPERIHTLNSELVIGQYNNIYGKDFVDKEPFNGCVYYQGKWAKVISYPKPIDLISNFSIF